MTKNQIIQDYAAPSWKLFCGSLLGVICYVIFVYLCFQITSGFWEVITGIAVEPPKIGFMSSYSVPAQNGYWVILGLVISGSLIFAGALPLLIGADFGKWALGIRFLDEDGQKIRLSHIAKKTGIEIGKLLLVTLPGPILGFTFGLPADPFSMIALILGLLILTFLSLKKDASGRTFSYVKSGIVPVSKKDVAAFQKSLNTDANHGTLKSTE